MKIENIPKHGTYWILYKGIREDGISFINHGLYDIGRRDGDEISLYTMGWDYPESLLVEDILEMIEAVDPFEGREKNLHKVGEL